MVLSVFKEFQKPFDMSRDLCRFQCFVLCIPGNMFKFSCDFHGISVFFFIFGKIIRVTVTRRLLMRVARESGGESDGEIGGESARASGGEGGK